MGLIGVSINRAQEAAQKLVRFGTDLLGAESRALVQIGKAFESRSKRLASGEVINVRTGALRNSIGFGVPFKDKDGAAIAVGVRRGAAEKYAPLHEFGGEVHRASKRGPSRAVYRARRYVGIAVDEVKPRLPFVLEEEIRRAVARANG